MSYLLKYLDGFLMYYIIIYYTSIEKCSKSKIVLVCMFHALKNKNIIYILGVKVQNMKMDFNIYGTWRRVGQWTLMMKNGVFYSAKSFSHPV